MSRNFELLQQMGNELELLPAAVVQAPQAVAEPVSFPSVPVPFDGVAFEEITALVQRVFLLPSSEAPHVVVFAGTEPGNGCTWMCARVGEALASQVAGHVCLVDANLRTPGLHEQFGVANHYGLSDALIQPEPINGFVVPLSHPNLAIVSCGGVIEKAQVLLTSKRMSARLAELRSIFDYVLVDSSAINSSKEAIVLGAASDGVLLVLKANSSRRETARSAVHELQAANVRILGAVLNQRTFPIPEGIYNRL
jgi:Mrp family chromosome partitioning ATPase